MRIKTDFDFAGPAVVLQLRAYDSEGKLLGSVDQPVHPSVAHDPRGRSSMLMAVAAAVQLLKNLSGELGSARICSNPVGIDWLPDPSTINSTKQ